jgi:hypothetical protein
VYICFAERGCKVSDSAPASTSRGPSSRHDREPFARPRRIFTVTGTETTETTAETISQARSGSSSSVAPAGLRHLADGAAEVDVDDVRAGGLDHLRRFRHHVGLRAEDLHGQRPLVGGDPQIAQRALVSVLQARAADHLGADKARAEAPSLAPEGLDADAGHRREHEPRRDLDVANPPGAK